MELRRLRYFMGVAAEGSLGRASRTLGIAQPALGRQIQMMEAELGVELFRRVPKGMILTEEGEYLKQALEHPLEQVNLALRNVRMQAVQVEASLVLGLPPLLAPTLGSRMMRRLRQDLPNLQLKIVEGDSTKLAADLSRALVDIALLVAIFPADKITHDPIVSDHLELVVPASSPEAGRSSIAFKDLTRLPLILPGVQAGMRTMLAKTEIAADVHLRVALEIDSIELRKQAVVADLGYAILPPVAFKAEAEAGALVGIPIRDPQLEQITRFAIRPRWRVTRETCDMIVAAILDETARAVSAGDWPATYILRADRDLRAMSPPVDDGEGQGG